MNNADSNDKSHNDFIISQFTKYAVPSAHLSEHSNPYGIELMLKLSKPQSSDVVLDVACGTGIVSCEFAKFVSHVTGIDLTPAMIEQAKQLQQEKQLKNITWKIGDVSKPPLLFDDSSFSIVVTRYSLHHLLQPEKVLQEILLTHLIEGIGIALDLKGERMFLTDLGGSVYSAKLNGSDKKEILYDQGNLTGIAYVELRSTLA